jgi:AcrR family transcriptional regulator
MYEQCSNLQSLFVSTDDVLPPPPWSAGRGRAPRAKAPITRDAIVAAAIPILDAEGLAAVSMRRVADALGTGPASLYQHVANKDELLELIFDAVAGEIALPDVDAEDWQGALKQVVREIRRTLSSHGELAYVTLGRVPTGPNALAITERMLAIMRAGGVADQVAAYAVDVLALFVGATSYEESIRARELGPDPTGEKVRAHVAEIRAYFKALPPGRFPVLSSMADTLTAYDVEQEDERFEFALDVLVGGLAAVAAARAAQPKTGARAKKR